PTYQLYLSVYDPPTTPIPPLSLHDALPISLDAFAGRSGALRPEVHALRPHPGQVETARNIRELLEGSTLVDIPYHLVPRFRTWRSEEHTSELQSRENLVCRLLLEKKKSQK